MSSDLLIPGGDDVGPYGYVAELTEPDDDDRQIGNCPVDWPQFHRMTVEDGCMFSCERGHPPTLIANLYRARDEYEWDMVMDMYTREVADRPLPPPEALPPDKPSPAVGRDLTDAGNAQRLVDRHAQDLRWCPALGWFVWDGRRWKRDSAMQIMELAKDTARSIYGEAQRATDTKVADSLARWAHTSQSRQRLDAMISLARSEPGVYVDADDLDRDPWLLNCQNGTLDLTTGTLRPHRREDLLTKIVLVDYRPDARSPVWDAFLRRIFDDHEALVDYVSRAVGYSLTGDTSERVLFLLHGTGRNGKSTLLEAVHHVLGDYAQSTPTQTLMAKRGDSIPNDIAALKGARFVTASESEEGKRLAVSQIKDLTGRDTVSARFMRAEWFSFRPSFKLWLATNHKPVAPATDQALWDRLRLIPFTVRISDREKDKQFGDKLEWEAESILAWAVRGCLAWQADKTLGSPPEVTEATAAYRNEMDRLGEFIAERCVVRPEAKVRLSALYDAYLAWCREMAEQPVESKPFRDNLETRGFRRDRSTGGRFYWFGIGLAAGVSGVVDSSGPKVGFASSGSMSIEETRNQVHSGPLVHSPTYAKLAEDAETWLREHPEAP